MAFQLGADGHPCMKKPPEAERATRKEQESNLKEFIIPPARIEKKKKHEKTKPTHHAKGITQSIASAVENIQPYV